MLRKNKDLIMAMVDDGVTQRALAEKARLHETRLSMIVNNRLVPSAAEAGRIARALHRRTDDLFSITA